MLFYGLFFLILWVLILIYPNLLAYIVAFFFIVVWMNILTLYFLFKKSTKFSDEGFIIGSYKVVKK